jgi:hypothetical protein
LKAARRDDSRCLFGFADRAHAPLVRKLDTPLSKDNALYRYIRPTVEKDQPWMGRFSGNAPDARVIDAEGVDPKSLEWWCMENNKDLLEGHLTDKDVNP